MSVVTKAGHQVDQGTGVSINELRVPIVFSDKTTGKTIKLETKETILTKYPQVVEKETEKSVVLKLSPFQWQVLKNIHSRSLRPTEFIPLFYKVEKQRLELDVFEELNDLFLLIDIESKEFFQLPELFFENIKEIEAVISSFKAMGEGTKKTELVKQAEATKLAYRLIFKSDQKIDEALRVIKSLSLRLQKFRFDLNLARTNLTASHNFQDIYQPMVEALEKQVQGLNLSIEAVFKDNIEPWQAAKLLKNEAFVATNSIAVRIVKSMKSDQDSLLNEILSENMRIFRKIEQKTVQHLLSSNVFLETNFVPDRSRKDFYQFNRAKKITDLSEGFFGQRSLERLVVLEFKEWEKALLQTRAAQGGVESRPMPANPKIIGESEIQRILREKNLFEITDQILVRKYLLDKNTSLDIAKDISSLSLSFNKSGEGISGVEILILVPGGYGQREASLKLTMREDFILQTANQKPIEEFLQELYKERGSSSSQSQDSQDSSQSNQARISLLLSEAKAEIL